MKCGWGFLVKPANEKGFVGIRHYLSDSLYSFVPKIRNYEQ